MFVWIFSMRHFPLFLAVQGRRVVVSGAGETALSKLRLLLKTEATVVVYGRDPHDDLRALAADGRLRLIDRPITHGDAICAALLYAANDEPDEDARAAAIGRAAGAIVCVVDNLAESDFITPAIVDRDPLIVAIGSEGAAPVLARRVKAQIEALLPTALGALAETARRLRPRADILPKGAPRRRFWSRFFDDSGLRAIENGGLAAAELAFDHLLKEERDAGDGAGAGQDVGRVHLIGAGPGDPELLTLRARRLLHDADVVVVDRLVPDAILELARREARILRVGKQPAWRDGAETSWSQSDINALLVREALSGATVARLKSGDPGVFGRLDEETAALREAGVPFDVTPGVTAASSAAASLGVSLTRRGRNGAFRLLTGHDVDGFAEQDWRTLARNGSQAAVYMGLRAARHLAGRLLMHGADPQTPVAIAENASRPDERLFRTTLAEMPDALAASGTTGPSVLLIGIDAPDAPCLDGAATRGRSFQDLPSQTLEAAQ